VRYERTRLLLVERAGGDWRELFVVRQPQTAAHPRLRGGQVLVG